MGAAPGSSVPVGPGAAAAPVLRGEGRREVGVRSAAAPGRSERGRAPGARRRLKRAGRLEGAAGAGKCGPAGGGGRGVPGCAPEASLLAGRPARLHLVEAAGPAHLRAPSSGWREGAAAASSRGSFLYCFPDLGPRRRPAEEGGEPGGGRRRRGAVRWLC